MVTRLQVALRRLGAVAAFSMAIVLTQAFPAHAHYTNQYAYYCGFGNFYECGYGWVASNHLQVGACDTREDGRGLYVRYWLSNLDVRTVSDGNGSATGCGLASPGINIVSYQVCSNVADPDPCTEPRGV